MKKQLRAIAAVFAALAMVVLGASAAQAYPNPSFHLSLDHHVVVGGHSFNSMVRANVTCTQWRVTFLDQTATTSNAKTFTHEFTTPVVAERETRYVHAQCTYDASAGVSGNALRVVAAKSPVLKQAVVVLPQKGNGNGNGDDDNNPNEHNGLPGTGGPGLWIPIVAGVLILGGGYAVLRNRRGDGDEGNQPTAPAA